jgi:hypothetical protein
MASVSRDSLAGYILEELIAYLIRNAGYRLLVDASQDPQEFVNKGNGLNIIGRGANHQVDVLGELSWIPAFTFPLRLIIEAKCRKDKTGIDVVRGMMAALLDVNQNNFPSRAGLGMESPRSKYTYVGAVFSVSGFSGPASDLALAHGISLVDLNTPEFKPLVNAARESADALIAASNEEEVPDHAVGDLSRDRFIRAVREAIRRELRTIPEDLYSPDVPVRLPHLAGIQGALAAARSIGELFVGMAAGPYLLLLKANDRQSFIDYATKSPTHAVSVRWSARHDEGRTWRITPVSHPEGYQLSFRLPERIAEWIAGAENARTAALQIKQAILSNISVYRHMPDRDQVIRLQYHPARIVDEPNDVSQAS